MEPIHGALNWNIDVIIRALYESLKGREVQTSFFKMQVKSQYQHCVDVCVQSLKSDAIKSRGKYFLYLGLRYMVTLKKKILPPRFRQLRRWLMSRMSILELFS